MEGEREIKISEIDQIQCIDINYYSDKMVVCGANRVIEIHEVDSEGEFKKVFTIDNVHF